MTLCNFTEPEYGDHFIVSTHPNARFLNTEGHTILSLNLSDIESESGNSDIYAYRSIKETHLL